MTDQSSSNRWRTRRWSPKLILTVVLCAAAGFLVSWWINRPEPPWLTFPDIRATYELGGTGIQVTGTYTATRTCPPSDDPNASDPLEWEQRVKGSQKEPIASYATQPDPPQLEIGTHQFTQEIPLNKGITPDGWVVAIVAACAQEPFAIRSRSVPVEFIEPKDNGGVSD